MKKVLLSLLLACSVANAEYDNGNKLLRDIEDPSAHQRMYALGYIVGVADTYENTSLCIPGTVTKGQLNDVVHQFLRGNPQLRDLAGDVLVLLALSEHWRCKQSGKKKSS